VWLGGYAWRLIVIGIVGLAALWLIRRLAPVLVPAVIALFLTRLLVPVSDRLRRSRSRPGLAAGATLLGFLVAFVAVTSLVVPSLMEEADTLGPTISEAIDELEDWLVDGPLELSRESVDRLRTQAGDAFKELLRSSSGGVIDGATLLAEAIAGLFLALLLTFFMLRDGGRLATWLRGTVNPARRESATRAAARGWAVLGGYLRGAATLGAVESVAIAIALLAVGARLVGPVMILTFVAAFVPIVGAIVAGVVAVLVALVTAGGGPALIVGIVALVVQQLDNDVLAPVVYGRALDLHPVVILLSVVTGGALFGLAGTLLAVPVVAVSVNVARELRAPPPETEPAAVDAPP
jgi:predicted PurR-regulated permease PerM